MKAKSGVPLDKEPLLQNLSCISRKFLQAVMAAKYIPNNKIAFL